MRGTDVARVLGIKPRLVRRYAQDGVLWARITPTGYEYDPRDVAEFAALRREKAKYNRRVKVP